MRTFRFHFQVLTFVLVLISLIAEPVQAKRKWRYFKAYTRPSFSNWAYDVGVGLSMYSGDLSTASEFGLQNNGLNPSISVNGYYHVTEYVSLRLGAGYFKLGSTTNDVFWKEKAFTSRNAEVFGALVHEFLPKGNVPYQDYLLHPYVFGGAGLVFFEPRDPDTKERLRPQGNNDGKSYGKSALMFPLGVGFNTYIFDNISAGFEASYRMCQTDFLDDASNPKFSLKGNDAYYQYRLKVNVQLTSFFKYKSYLRNQ